VQSNQRREQAQKAELAQKLELNALPQSLSDDNQIASIERSPVFP
jgi:hypothetical protein